jgi:hypothetical protein
MAEEDRIKEYIGDGVYASFDGWHIWLETQRLEGPQRIALEPATFDALCQFVERLAEERRKQQNEQ